MGLFDRLFGQEENQSQETVANQEISETEAFKNHRVMASILSAILKMSPVKQLLARDQVKSIYLDRLLRVKK